MPVGQKGRSTSPLQVPECITYKPTWEEFQNFEKYVEFLESEGAHKAGIVKVIPPPEWNPRKEGYNLEGFNYTIDAPVKQHFKVVEEKGSYQTKGLIQQPMTVIEYEKLANSNEYKPPHHTNHDELERKYWKTLSFCPPIYGCDVANSIMDEDLDAWNIRDLKTILNLVNEDYNQQLKGVNTPYLYFGMWKATFSWHVEDMDLHSINYLHYGAPKTWYCVPPQYGYLLEAAARELFPHIASWCSNFMRHKTCLISPSILDKLGVPYQKVVQEERNAIIVFPYAYHSGFNHGFNIAESTNFAVERWVEYGKRARHCDCQRSRVMFSMDTFVKKYQPAMWESWKRGTDIKPHPEDPPEVVAEFQLRKENPKEYAKLKQDKFMKRNSKYKAHYSRQHETKFAQCNPSQETKVYFVYQHHEYFNVKITLDPETNEIIGNGRDLLEKFLDADDVDITDLIEKSVLIKIGEKAVNIITEPSNKESISSDHIQLSQLSIHIYRHIDLNIEAKVDPQTLKLIACQSNELNEYLKSDKDIKELISLGIFRFSREDNSAEKNPISISDSKITDKDIKLVKSKVDVNMGSIESNKLDRTMELMDMITAHIYRDMTSKEMISYLPRCRKFVGPISESTIRLIHRKSIHDLVEEGKLVKVGQRRLCPEEAISLIRDKIVLNRTVVYMKISNYDEPLKVEVATHTSQPNRLVLALSYKNLDSSTYSEAKQALENNAFKNLQDEGILQTTNTCIYNTTAKYSIKGEMLHSALVNEATIIKCSNHVNEARTMSSTTKSSSKDCKCTLKGVLKLRNSLIGDRTKTGSKSIIVSIHEYSKTVSIENRQSDELYVVKYCSLPKDITTEQYESEDESEKKHSSIPMNPNEVDGNGIHPRRKRKINEIDDIREPYNSEDETEIVHALSDESKESDGESSDDPDFGSSWSKSYQWKSKKAAKKKKVKKLVPSATRVGVPGHVIEKRRESQDQVLTKSKKNRSSDPSLFATANSLINYFEDDENLDEDFNLIFYCKDLARKLNHEPNHLLDVLKIFKEFHIVTRVLKKPHDKDYHRFEWNGIEEDSIHKVLNQIYLGNVGMLDEAEPSELWKTCVEVLEILTRSRKDEPYTIYNLSYKYSASEVKEFVKVFSILESLKLVVKKNYTSGQTKQTFYIYAGPDIASQDIRKIYSQHVDEFDLKQPKLVLTRCAINPEDISPYLNDDEERISEDMELSEVTKTVNENDKTEEKIRSLANKNRVCHCGYDKNMEVKVNRDGQNAYFKKTVRTGFKKRSRCKQCKGCLASKCGKCTPCLRPSMKKPCVDKVCLYPVVPNCPCFS